MAYHFRLPITSVAELKHQIIKDYWRTVALEKVVDDISKEQRSHEKSTSDD